MSKGIHGFSLLDVLIAMAVLAIVSSIAAPIYSQFADDANDTAAASEIMQIQLAIDRFNSQTFTYPDSLDELPEVPAQDPWGNAYVYLRIDGNGTPGLRGRQRKDKNLNPLNTDFDLYSTGKDGATRLPLTAPPSHDDIIRAGNGSFVGRGEDH